MAAEIYISGVDTPIPLRPVPIPDVAGGSTIGAALAGFGQAAGGAVDFIRAASEEAKGAQATTTYLTRLDELRSQYEKDPDFATAPARFAEERTKLEGELLNAGFSNEARAKLELTFRRAGLADQGALDRVALSRTVDATEASLDAQESIYYGRYRAAGSPTEAAAVAAEYERLLDAPAATGLVSQVWAEQRKQLFRGALQAGDATALIQERPDLALTALRDGSQFTDLSPKERAVYIGQAIDAQDTIVGHGVVQRAQFKPETASLEVGTVLSASHVEAIFDGAVIQQESGGDPTAESPKGAVGLAQLMLPTAREMAAKLGHEDVATLSDADLKARLKADPVLNRDLGKAYLREMVVRYEGNLPLALAAYNAGPARADRWKAKAVELYGPGASPAQIVSVIDFAETSDYVKGIYARSGAQMNVALSPMGRMKAAGQVGDVIAAEDRRIAQAVISVASAERPQNQIEERLWAGIAVDDGTIGDYLQTQRLAAAQGSVEAATEVRKVVEALEARPFVEQAYTMPPAQLSTAIDLLETSLADGGSDADYRRLTAFRAVEAEITKRVKDNPIALGERAGVVVPIMVDPAASFRDPAMLDAIAGRGRQALAVAATYGAELMPFKPAEAAQLQARWKDALEGERAEILGGLAAISDDRAYRAAVSQVTGGSAVDEAAGLIARDRPDVARQILRGADLLKAPEIEKDAATVRDALQKQLGGVLFPDTKAHARVVEAALAYHAATRGSLWADTDPSAIEAAIEAVAGATVRRSGGRFLAPPGMSAAQANALLDGLTAEDLARAGNAFDANGQPFDLAFVSRNAVLTQVAPFGSSYVVGIPDPRGPDGFALVQRDDGSPLVLDLAQIYQNTPARNRPAFDRQAAYRATQMRWAEDMAGGQGAGGQ